MKKIFYLVIAVLTSTALCACEKEKIITENDLPEKSKTFITAHFPDAQISLSKKDRDSYDVYLSNGFEIEFNRSGEWDEVNGHTLPVPQSIMDLLPNKINEYLALHFQGINIVEINKEPYGYEVGLSNGLDLRFNPDGSFRNIDD